MRSPHRRHELPFLYKYMSAEVACIVLETGKLRWSSPLIFNDPFDVPPALELPFNEGDIAAALEQRIREYVLGTAEPVAPWAIELANAARSQPPHKRDLLLHIIHASVPDLLEQGRRAIAGFQSGWTEKVKHLRILCYSANGDSPLMWAHYASGRAGVVLQFASSDERDSSSLLATPVIYREEPPKVPLLDRWVRSFLQEEAPDWNEYFHEYYYVKNVDWKYEQEYRSITASLEESDALHTDVPFIPEDLTGVILGPAISSDQEAMVRMNLGRYPNVQLYRAREDHLSRRVVADLV